MKSKKTSKKGVFNRHLPELGLEKLHALAASTDDNWWKDLLSHWRPAGFDSGQCDDTQSCDCNGLRIAVRDGYLNFYRRGQSVAKVSFVENEPIFTIHAEYVWPGNAKTYVEMAQGKVRGRADVPYSRGTLRRWIANADGKSDAEKQFVDELLTKNPNAIDVEMGIPGVSQRIDLVTLYDVDGEFRLAFWEVKLRKNGELKSEVASPKVLGQLANYQRFLSRPERSRQISAAYIETCKLLRELHDMASRASPSARPPPLSPLILRIAAEGTNLLTDQDATLVIYEDMHRAYDEGAWSIQLENLAQNAVPLITLREAKLLSRVARS